MLNILGRIRQNGVETLLSLHIRHGFFHIFLVVIERLRGARRSKDSPNGEFKIGRENSPGDNDLLPDLPAKLLRFLAVYHCTGTVPLPGNDLVFGNFPIFINLKEFVGVSPELRKEILRFRVLVHPAKPVLRHHYGNPRKGADLLPIKAWHGEGERHLMPGDQPERRLLRAFGHIEVAPDCHHQGQ